MKNKLATTCNKVKENFKLFNVKFTKEILFYYMGKVRCTFI